jgi:hypothetical protein
MATVLGLYNGALRKLGEPRLASVSDETKGRRALDSAYAEIVKWCLEQALWNFAMRTVEAEADPSATTSFGYTYVFAKPDDWIRTSALTTDEYGRCPLLDYDDVTDYWLADTDPIYVRYVSNHADYGMDLGRWPESFNQFVQCALAHEVCEDITGSDSRKENLKKDMIRAKRDAANKDAMNQPATRFPPSGRLVGSRGESFGREGKYRAG